MEIVPGQCLVLAQCDVISVQACHCLAAPAIDTGMICDSVVEFCNVGAGSCVDILSGCHSNNVGVLERFVGNGVP